MKGKVLLIAGLVLLAGCELSKGVAVDKGKDMVASTLKDPGSAKFGRVFMNEESKIGDTTYGALCGTVNSKNSFGGYTGEHRFSAQFQFSKGGSLSLSDLQLEEGTLAELGPDGKSLFETHYWQNRCVEKIGS